MSSYRPKGTIINPELTEFIIKAWNEDQLTYTMISRAVLEKFKVVLSPSAIGGRFTRASAAGRYIRRVGGLQGAKKAAEAKAAAEGRDRPKRAPRTHKERSLLGSKPPLPAPPDDLSCQMTLEEVQATNSCRWPAGHRPNMRFCGRKKSHKHESYCEDHAKKSIAEFQPVWDLRP